MDGCIRNQVLQHLYEDKINDEGIFQQFDLPLGIFFKLLENMKKQNLVKYDENIIPKKFDSQVVYPPRMNIQLELTELGKRWTKKVLIDKFQEPNLGGNDMMQYFLWNGQQLRIPEVENLSYQEYKSKFIHWASATRLDNRMLYYLLTGKIPTAELKKNETYISTTATWLEPYRESHKLFINALDKFDRLQLDRSLLDDLRLSLELFMKEYFNNKKPLEKQKEDINTHLTSRKVSDEIRTLYGYVHNKFYNYQNDAVKHWVNYQESEIEFTIELTASLMRLLLRTK